MTKKDFELIAATLAEARSEFPRVAEYIDNTSIKFARALATTNPRFDRARFLAACGVQS